MADDLIFRLRERARIRRLIPGRKSVQEGERDRIADLLDEAADVLAKRHKRMTLFKIAIMAANLLAALVADSIYEMGGATAPAVWLIVLLNLGSMVLLMQRKCVV
jgi:hypothetical protein